MEGAAFVGYGTVKELGYPIAPDSVPIHIGSILTVLQPLRMAPVHQVTTSMCFAVQLIQRYTQLFAHMIRISVLPALLQLLNHAHMKVKLPSIMIDCTRGHLMCP